MSSGCLQALDENAFYRLWAALGDGESFLHLGVTTVRTPVKGTLKVRGLGKAGITSEDQRGPELLMERVDRIARPSTLPRKVLEGARRLLQKLAQNDSVMGASRASQERSKKYRELACLIHQTLDHLETDQPQVLEAVLRQYAECVDDCIYRWEREIHNMHDMVTGEATCDDALDAEDAILRVLYNERRQMAEGVLHSTKGALQSAADMHFESHFYASVHFGLAEQLTARQDLFKDPHRLTYLTMDSGLRADQLKAKIREVLRREVLESKAKGSQALREKLLDWLKVQVAITPFPFPYHNIIAVFLWMYTILCPILINGIIMDVTLRGVFVFVSVFCYHALNHIGDNLEDPYLPYDPNELPLPDLQHSVNMRLWAFGVVPKLSDSPPPDVVVKEVNFTQDTLKT
eukprot:s5208_g2.t1